MQAHLALCCKATLPILCMGHVTISTNKHKQEGPLVKATHCLTKQPGGVSHLEVVSNNGIFEEYFVNTGHLVELRYASGLVLLAPFHAVTCKVVPLLLLCHSQ